MCLCLSQNVPLWSIALHSAGMRSLKHCLAYKFASSTEAWTSFDSLKLTRLEEKSPVHFCKISSILPFPDACDRSRPLTLWPGLRAACAPASSVSWSPWQSPDTSHQSPVNNHCIVVTVCPSEIGCDTNLYQFCSILYQLRGEIVSTKICFRNKISEMASEAKWISDD